MSEARSEVAEKVDILVVDDHPENVLALRGTLSRPDYNIVTAASGGEALKKVLKHDFAVVLLDVVMPNMDGFETARLIRERDASRHLPIIFLTATGAAPRFVNRGYSVGAVDYLVKPVDPDVVKAKVSVFVDLFRKAQRIREQEVALRECERRRSEEVLRESEALYEASFEHAAVGIAHTAPDGRWLRVNPSFCEILGYSREELLKLRFQDVTHPDDVAEGVAAMHRLLEGSEGSYRSEKRYLSRNGRVIWVNLTISVVRDAALNPKHFVSVIEDVTERKETADRQQFLAQASEVLLQSLDYRKTLTDVARLAVPMLADGCIVEIALDGSLEEVALAHVDAEKAEVLRELRGRLHAGEGDGVEKALRTRRPVRIPDAFGPRIAAWAPNAAALSLARRMGTCSSLVVPLVARERVLGAITFLVSERRFGCARADLAIAEDLAHRVAFAVENARLYKEAQDAVSARDEFLSIASHELRTPLTPLQILLQRLIGDRRPQALEKLPPERMRAALERAQRQVQRLAALVDNLLDVSRIRAGVLKLEVETCDLAEATRDVASRFADEISRTGSSLEVRAEPSVTGSWDRLRVEQVLTNLVANAIKYGDGKPIEITVDRVADMARFRIQDHGIGIDPQKSSRIFDRFERAVSSRSYGGLGLGLYIARQIVEAHGGRIRVASQPGAGSLFTVELPLEPVTTESAEEVEQLGKEYPDGAASHPH